MSTSAVPIRTLPVLVNNSSALASAAIPAGDDSLAAPRATPREASRRPNRAEAVALRQLASAVEYLADMRIWDSSGVAADAEAMRVLMHCSREVFAGCATRPSLPSRLSARLRELMRRR